MRSEGWPWLWHLMIQRTYLRGCHGLEGPHILDPVQRIIVGKTPFDLLCTSTPLLWVVSLHAQSCEGSEWEASDLACGEFLWYVIWVHWLLFTSFSPLKKKFPWGKSSYVMFFFPHIFCSDLFRLWDVILSFQTFKEGPKCSQGKPCVGVSHVVAHWSYFPHVLPRSLFPREGGHICPGHESQSLFL